MNPEFLLFRVSMQGCNFAMFCYVLLRFAMFCYVSDEVMDAQWARLEARNGRSWDVTQTVRFITAKYSKT